jgi:hypothetical protein
VADLSKSAHKSFSFEDDLCKFLRSGMVAGVIAIVPMGTGYVLFYIKAEVTSPFTKEKTTSKGVK